MKVEEFIELAKSRYETYKFLSMLYNYSALNDIAKQIKEGSFLSAVPDSEGEGFKLLKKFAQDAKGKNLLEELQVEHTGLFVIPKFTKGRPYESFYLDREQKVGGRITQEVKRFYELAGAELTSLADELPDFIGIELEFMHFLCAKEEESWKAKNFEHAVGYLRFEEIFLREHLGKWAEDFCRDFYKDANSDFFRGVSKIVEEFIAMEKKEIRGLLRNAEEKFLQKGGEVR